MKYYILLCLLFINYRLNAQIITVRDKKSNKNIEDVIIVSNNPKIMVTTDSLGKANIDLFNNSEKIIFKHLDYNIFVTSYKEIVKNNLIVYLEPAGVSLDQIVVSANKWSELNTEIPAKIVKISAKDIEFQNPQTAADMLGFSGEVFIQKTQQGGGSPMIRGFATNRLLINVDGIRMNTAIFRSGNLQNVISLDNFAIENIEVLFGPSSVMYGSDAIGGVMCFYTLTPNFSFNNSTLTKGSIVYRNTSANNENTGHIDFNLGWENFAVFSSVTFSDFGNVKMGSFGPKEYLRNNYVERINDEDVIIMNTEPLTQKFVKYSQFNLMQKFSYKMNSNWNLDYGFHYSTTSDYNRYDRLIRYKNELPRSAEWYYGPQIWMMNNLNITNTKSNIFYDETIIRLGYQFFEESRHNRDFNKTIRFNKTEKVKVYSINVDLSKGISSKEEIFYGFEETFNDVNSFGKDTDIETNISSKGASRYPQSKWNSLAAYLTYNNKLSSQIIFESGIRFSYFTLDANFDTTFYPFPFTDTTTKEGSFSGNLGFVYNYDTNSSIYLNLSTGFRAPNVDDLGKVFDSEPGSIVVPNTDLISEYAYNVDFGIAKVFNQFLKINANTFYSILNNAMVRRNFTLNGLDSIYYDGKLSRVQAIQNAAKAFVWGFQGGIEVKNSYGLGISMNLNFQKGKEELEDGTKSPLRHAAPLFGTAHFTYSLSKLKFDFYGIFNGKISFNNMPEEEKGKNYIYAIDKNGNPYSPSWYTLNIKTYFQLNDNLSFVGGIENITDQRYRPFSSGLVSPGRNFILSSKIKI